MGTDRRRAIAVAVGIVLVLLLGVVAVVSSGGDDDGVSTAERASTDDRDRGGDDDTPSGTADGSSGTTGVAAGDDGEGPTSAGGSSTTVTSPTATTAGGQEPPSEGLGPAQDPGPTSPPAPGTYRYRFEGEGMGQADGSDEGSRESTTTITDISRQGDVVRQTVDMSGGQFEGSSTVEWRPDRVLVARSVFRFGNEEADCDWEPDYLQAVLPLREGSTWEARSSCTVSGFGVPITVERTTTNRVIGLERRQIAGRVLDLWVIESDDTIRFSTEEVRSQVRSWFSPPLGIVAAAEGTFEGGAGTGSGGGRFSTELVQLP